MVQNLPTKAADTGDTHLIPGWGRYPEGEMATHSSIVAWKILWTEEPGQGYSPWGHRDSDMTEHMLAMYLLVTKIFSSSIYFFYKI